MRCCPTIFELGSSLRSIEYIDRQQPRCIALQIPHRRLGQFRADSFSQSQQPLGRQTTQAMRNHLLQFLVLGAVSTFVVFYNVISYNTHEDFKVDQEHRSLQLGDFLQFTRFVGPTLCWLGIDLSSIIDLGDALPGGIGGFNPLDLLGSCVCKDYQVEAMIAASTPGTLSQIELCAGTIRVQKPFEVTNRDLQFGCTTPAIFACGFSALDAVSIFTGTPNRLIFTQTKFTRAINAIKLMGGTLTLTNVGFVNNEGKLGSAVSMTNGTVTINQGTFRENEATGDAVSWKANHLLERVFSRVFLQPYGGGAVFLDNSTLTAQSGRGFFENYAAGNGGAILAVDSILTIRDITFQDNRAGDFGDAIALFKSELSLSETIFLTGGSKNRNKNKHLRRLGSRSSSREDDDEIVIQDDHVREQFERFGDPTEFSDFTGSGNLIFIGDDEDPASGRGNFSFVDCSTSDPPFFCGGVDILEVGDEFNNTNCRGIDNSDAAECEIH